VSANLQVWLSPWQVSHVLSIVSFVESTLNRVVGPEPGVAPTTPIALATSPDQSAPTGLAASAMKTQLKLTLSVEISLVSVLCLVSCDETFMQSAKVESLAAALEYPNAQATASRP